MAVLSNLYPPILPDSCPAFIRSQPCRVYFSLSIYNLITDIAHVQVSLVNQRTNTTAFNTEIYPSGIKITDFLFDPKAPDNYNYYIEINPKDLQEGIFGINQFYKLQLRFSSVRALTIENNGNKEYVNKGIANWLYENRDNFSEWSKVCLIKGIDEPKITIHGFDDQENLQETVIPTSLVEIVGKLSYEDKDEKEYLKSYNIKIYEEEDLNTPIFDSGQIYSNPYNPNELNYTINYNLLDGTYYIMTLTYTTNNLYVGTVDYRFIIVQYGETEKLNATITATPDDENGRIIINLVSNNDDEFLGNFTIRRTSSKSDFHIWEDVKTVAYFSGTKLDYTWYDNTIQSGVWYKYCAQRRNPIGMRGPIIQTEEPVMCLLDDIFLTKEGCQMKIQFNPSLNEFKYNVTESQQVTIGAQYPYIRRNGYNYFRTFPIGGLISSFMDTTDWYDPHFYDGEFHNNENEIKDFTSKLDIYGEHKELYKNYNQENNITEYNDYIYEREFREKVYDFLYKNDAKLFRSTTEGNILIKLMNIDFQPVESLGRRLYSFTATAVEIDEANITNYDKYKINSIGTYQKYIVFEHDIPGFVQGTFSVRDGNIINKINQKYSNTSNSGFINTVEQLKTLKLQIESEPYVIIEGVNGPIKATKASEINAPDATVGYIVKINGNPIIIRPNTLAGNRSVYNITEKDETSGYLTVPDTMGFFELKDNNITITRLEFPYQTSVTVNCTAVLNEAEDLTHLVNRYYYYYKPGQLYGTFSPDQSLIKKIYNKYLLKYKEYFQKLIDVNGIKIEGPQGAIVYVKDSKDDNFNRHILENGFLQLYDEDAVIEGLYFGGVHLLECKNPLEIFSVNGIKEFNLQEGLYDSLSDIIEKNPKDSIITGNMYQVSAYGFKRDGLFFENHKVLLIDDQNLVQIKTDNSGKLYTLKLDTIDDDETLRFVYYYGCWYLFPKAQEISTKLLKADIRGVRDNEFIFTNETYQDFNEIKNPIKNGVYHISPLVVNDEQASFEDENSDILDVHEEAAYFEQVDQNYSLVLKRLFKESENNYIYYHNHWYPFTNNHDVICPVDGIVDYYAEVMKGVYV